MSTTYPPPATRKLITLFIMAAAVMNQIDTTIANVALPHIQGSTSASREQISWVLTSYIVSAAIFTPMTGWLAGRFGRRRLILASIVGFTFASGLCGIATNLEELIAFRILQGVFGSSLVPMSQATLFDINPPEEYGKSMAIFGLAAIVGPLFGPLLGGYLTANFSWRWVFLINLPLGAASFVGLLRLMPESRDAAHRQLDVMGYGLLAIGIGALQLMLDRGPTLDWFESTEIIAESAVAATCFFMFAVHSMTARQPFISAAVFADRNFVICGIVGVLLGILIYSPMALLPQLLSNLMGYPVLEIGMVMAPRGIGVLVAMLIVGRIINRVDMRVMVFVGLLFNAAAQFALAGMSLQSDDTPMLVSGILQGIGSSSIFVPLSTMAFLTLAPRYRNEGAALQTLMRNMGGAVGIALLQALTTRNEAIVQSRLTEGLRPDNPAFNVAVPDFDAQLPGTFIGLEHEVARQAMMVAYVDSFWALFVIGVLSSLLVLLLRSPKRF